MTRLLDKSGKEEQVVVAGWLPASGRLSEVAEVYSITCPCGNQASAYVMRDEPSVQQRFAAAVARAWASFGSEARMGTCRPCKVAYESWKRGVAYKDRRGVHVGAT
jgi:hypothetical protein